LRGGEKILAAVLDAGYNSPSAFIACFKKLMGCIPRRHFDRDPMQ
jgi:AraC-like DNA-binding protein